MGRQRADHKRQFLTELELTIMQAIWQGPGATVGEVQDALDALGRALTPQSIRTMLAILQEKGYVVRRKSGPSYVYSAKVPQTEAQKRMLRDFVKRAFRGSAMNLVAALVNAEMVSEDELTVIKDMIEAYEQGGKDERA